jgi:hypothetical protein
MGGSSSTPVYNFDTKNVENVKSNNKFTVDETVRYFNERELSNNSLPVSDVKNDKVYPYYIKPHTGPGWYNFPKSDSKYSVMTHITKPTQGYIYHRATGKIIKCSEIGSNNSKDHILQEKNPENGKYEQCLQSNNNSSILNMHYCRPNDETQKFTYKMTSTYETMSFNKYPEFGKVSVPEIKILLSRDEYLDDSLDKFLNIIPNSLTYVLVNQEHPKSHYLFFEKEYFAKEYRNNNVKIHKVVS